MSETHQSHVWFFTKYGARCTHCGCEMFDLMKKITTQAKEPCPKASPLSRPGSKTP